MNDHYVYLLRCDDGTLYTGYTTEPARRVVEHDEGRGAKYTRGRTPVELVHLERHPSRSDALSREHEVKTFSRAEKRELCAYPDGIDPERLTARDPRRLAVAP